MEHVSSVRPTGKFPEKVENLKRWSSSRSTVGHRATYRGLRPNGTTITNRKFHFCYHRNFRGFVVNGKRPRFPRQENLGPYLKLLEILKLENLVKLKIATFISQIRNKGHLFSELLLSVSYIHLACEPQTYVCGSQANIHSHSTRYTTQDNCYRIHARTNYGKFSFKVFASKLWESLTMSLKLLPPNSFRAHYKLDF